STARCRPSPTSRSASRSRSSRSPSAPGSSAAAATASRSMSELRIGLEEVSLCYRLAKHRIPSFKEYAIHWMRGALTYEKLWALRGISLTMARGETVGIVGRNGAGKSTLLKVISRVLKPTTGKIDVRGILAPILRAAAASACEPPAPGTPGRTAVLSARRRRGSPHHPAPLVGFPARGAFAPPAFRTSPSGMTARLGFAIATAWTPDILILDEI